MHTVACVGTSIIISASDYDRDGSSVMIANGIANLHKKISKKEILSQ